MIHVLLTSTLYTFSDTDIISHGLIDDDAIERASLFHANRVGSEIISIVPASVQYLPIVVDVEKQRFIVSPPPFGFPSARLDIALTAGCWYLVFYYRACW